MAKNAQQKFYVVGHTDSEGEFAFNMKLSSNRADTVVNSLVKKHKVAVSRLRALGVGPVSSNAMNSSRAENRRVELVLQD